MVAADMVAQHAPSAVLMLSSAVLALLVGCGLAGAAGTRTVDVVTFANSAYAVGIAALIRASRKHSSARVRVWVGYDGDPVAFFNYLSCLGINSTDVVVRRPHALVDAVCLSPSA